MSKKEQPTSLLRRLIYLLPLLLMFLSVFSVTAIASNMNSSDQSMEVLEQGETLQGPGFFSGNNVQIDGTVEGTTFAAGNVVHVNGKINGSLFVAAQTVVINGEITGNIYVAGQNVNVDGQIRGDVFLAGATVIVNSQAKMRRDLFATGSTVIIEGAVPRHLYGAGQQFTLNGAVDGNAYLDAQQLSLKESAVIAGDLNYTSPNKVQSHSNAVVNGKTNWTESSQMSTKQEPSQMSKFVMALLGVLWSLLSALLVWFMLKLWRPDIWKRTILPISEAPLKTLGVGLLTLIAVPIAVIILFVTIIGIPLGIILFTLYLLLLYLSHIAVAVFIGFWLINRLKWRTLQKEIWFVLLGLIIIEVISWIPLLDFLFGITILLLGLGAFVLAHYKSKVYDTY